MPLKLSTKSLCFLDIMRHGDFENTISHLREVFSYNHEVQLNYFHNTKQLSEDICYEIPHWVTALAFRHNIFMVGEDDISPQLLIHEFTHLCTNKYRSKGCPLWLYEGLALYYAKQAPSYVNIFFQKESINRDFFINLSPYNLSYDNEELYFISALIITALNHIYGIDKIISRLNNLSSYDDFIKDAILGEVNIKKVLEDFSTYNKKEVFNNG